MDYDKSSRYSSFLFRYVIGFSWLIVSGNSTENSMYFHKQFVTKLNK